ncbi:putative carboxypeptidase suro-1 [Lachnellula cervina]|uniref:Putative carboxypeptidase suro-1 n=1 Tax=Lachnellula cervina TaxID=1316786 RepID=A0A7D8UV77_9HELO|nr:putative carboxypeptidase suro-1 [Lachnellula cervina]
MKFSSFCCVAALAPLLSSACLLPEEREGRPTLQRRQTSNNGIAIGTGDRYSSGTIAPRGLGTQQNTTLTTLLNVDEIASGLKGLSNVYGIPTFTTPYTTYNGASFAGGKVGGNGSCNEAYRVYLNTAIHARERGGSDGLLFFIGDLLYANKNNIGLTYGSKSYTNAQVVSALSTGIVFMPLSNPDGVAYDQSSNSCWRKNRNPASSTGSPDSIGVDLNRNFDFLWDFKTLFASSAQGVASANPSASTFHGTSAFSEPETQSIKWITDTYSKIRWFIDLHSYSGDVLYSWGSDTDQSQYPYMNFMNSSYDDVRGILTDTPGVGNGYGEYTPADEGTANVDAATRISNGMGAAAGRGYKALPAAGFYPTSGSSDDYQYSRHFADPSKNLIHAYTVEFGFRNNDASCVFYPSPSQHNKNIMEIGAGFMELLLAAVDIGVGDPVSC